MLTYSILDYLYVPPTQPMDIEGWPTLADMIISGKRVVAMLAYEQKLRRMPLCLAIFASQEA